MAAAKGCATGMLKRRQKIRHRRIGSRIGTGNAKAALLEHSRQRSHRSAADSNQVNVFASLIDLWTTVSSGLHVEKHSVSSVVNLPHPADREETARTVADSIISSFTVFAVTFKAARTPKGNVILPRETCPDRKPKATGTPRSPTTRMIDILQNIGLIFILIILILVAIDHFAENNASHFIQFSGQLQLHQHAVNLIRLGGDVLDKQDCARRCGSHKACPEKPPSMDRHPP